MADMNQIPQELQGIVQELINDALREAAWYWKPYIAGHRCPTCQTGRVRQTVNLVCQTCGTDYST